MKHEKSDVFVNESDAFEALVRLARETEGADGVRQSLDAAAALVEHAAYEVARLETASQVARLIQLAAELEKLGRSLGMRKNPLD